MKVETPKHIVFFVFDGCQLLDYSGVAAVYEMANRCSGKSLYKTSVVCTSGNKVQASNGLAFDALSYEDFVTDLNVHEIDLLVVIGGDKEPLVAAVQDLNTQKVLTALSNQSKRKCSVCSGAFFFAQIGLLDGKKATTHWSGIDELKQRFPKVKVQNHVLFTIDDDVVTSAGVTTGIDLALELLTQDDGIDLSVKVAKRLVVSMHRPGNSSQIASAVLQQNDKHHQFRSLCLWLKSQLEKDISINEMADYMHMSARNFSRKFSETMKVSPHQYFLSLKMQHVKLLLSRGYNIDQVCEATGYKNKQSLSRIFEQQEGMSTFQFKTSLSRTKAIR